MQFEKYNIEFSFVDFTNLDAIKAAIKPNTRLIFSETPTNPTLNLADIEAISKIAKDKGIVHCCDATVAGGKHYCGGSTVDSFSGDGLLRALGAVPETSREPSSPTLY